MTYKPHPRRIGETFRKARYIRGILKNRFDEPIPDSLVPRMKALLDSGYNFSSLQEMAIEARSMKQFCRNLWCAERMVPTYENGDFIRDFL